MQSYTETLEAVTGEPLYSERRLHGDEKHQFPQEAGRSGLTPKIQRNQLGGRGPVRVFNKLRCNFNLETNVCLIYI